MCELLLDTDVLIKLAAYDLLVDTSHPGCRPGCQGSPGLIGAARFASRNHLRRKSSDPDAALARLDEYLVVAAILEPTELELEMAADLEGAAALAGVDLDVGESQLCAIAVSRGHHPLLLTGDKRAIAAAERLLENQASLHALAGRLACLEQAVTLAATRLGALQVRDKILVERGMDKAVDICFQVTNPNVAVDFWPTGLSSYIADLRVAAPTMLQPGDCLTLN